MRKQKKRKKTGCDCLKGSAQPNRNPQCTVPVYCSPQCTNHTSENIGTIVIWISSIELNGLTLSRVLTNQSFVMVQHLSVYTDLQPIRGRHICTAVNTRPAFTSYATECPKSVLHLLKYRFAVYLRRWSTDLR